MNKHFTLTFSLADRPLLFASYECIMHMTFPNWKYYSEEVLQRVSYEQEPEGRGKTKSLD